MGVSQAPCTRQELFLGSLDSPDVLVQANDYLNLYDKCLSWTELNSRMDGWTDRETEGMQNREQRADKQNLRGQTRLRRAREVSEICSGSCRGAGLSLRTPARRRRGSEWKAGSGSGSLLAADTSGCFTVDLYV